MADHSLAKLLLENLTDLLQPGDTLKLESGRAALVHYGVVVAVGLEAVAEYLTRKEENHEL